MRAFVVIALLALDCIAPAAAEVMKMTITPEHELRIGGVSIRSGVLAGNREDLLRLGRNRLLIHKDCEFLLLRNDQVPSDASILRPMVSAQDIQLAIGQILLELPSITINLPLSKIANRPVSSRLQYEWRSVPLSLSHASPPTPGPSSPNARPAMSLSETQGCRLEEACVSTDQNLTGKVECGAVSFGISTNKKVEFGAGPIMLSVEPKKNTR